MAVQQLKREVFRTSRELEYFTVKELTAQTGHGPELWPVVVLKELVDNSLDACESAGVLPEIGVYVEPDALTVVDNGPGLPASVIESVLDFSIRASSKDAYISPTRGAQGNALKTVLAIPYVLSVQDLGRVEITSQGERHIITVQIDRIAQRPKISHERKPDSVVRNGTQIKVFWSDSSSLLDDDQTGSFLQRLEGYSLFNPHASFLLQTADGHERAFNRTLQECQKWLTSEPTSPHWYTEEQLRALVAAYITSEDHGAEPRTVRAFISEFRGLSGTAKQKKILADVGLSGVFLHDLVKDGDVDASVISRLLEAMKSESKPVKPAALGVIGEDHFRAWFDAQGVELRTLEYRRMAQIDSKTLRPCVVEFAFAARNDARGRHLITGINWSPTLIDPFRSFASYGFGLEYLLGELRVYYNSPVSCVLHLASPHLNYTDRGKSSLEGL